MQKTTNIPGTLNIDSIPKEKNIYAVNDVNIADIDYVSIANTETLNELDEVRPPSLVSLAVRIGKTRLIDNIMLE